MSTLAPVVPVETVWELVEEVWESLLGTTVVRAERAFGLDDAVTAAVALHGEWTGLVTVTCPPADAAAVAQVMLDLPTTQVPTPEDVVDALGEIANVLGGNVKALVPSASRLGLPRVGRGLVPSQAQPLCRTGLEWAGHVARVAVWHLVDLGSTKGATDGGQDR